MKQELLRGTSNVHILDGKFTKEGNIIRVEKDSLLKHETPTGKPSEEHKTLKVKSGFYVQGQQVEYNPFTRSISQIWD